MADVKIRYFVKRTNKHDGTVRHYWQPSDALAAKGWATLRLPDELGPAIAMAQARNAELDAWRASGEKTLRPEVGSLKAMITAYQADRAFTTLRASTQRTYKDLLGVLERWMGHAPARALTAPMADTFYQQLYWKPKAKKEDPDELNTPAKANGVVRTGRLLWEWGIAKGFVSSNIWRPIAIVGHRAEPIIWPRAAVLAFAAAADKMDLGSIGSAVMLNEWLGQRQGDILAFPRTRYRNGALVVRQQKIEGTVVKLPVDLVPHLKARLERELERFKDATVVPAELFVCEATGRRWTKDHFRHEVARVRATLAKGDEELGIAPAPEFAHDDDVELEEAKVATKDLDFMHLRHTAVTRLGSAGATEPEISAVTGHSLGTVHTILERYLVRTTPMAIAAFKKRLDVEGADGK